MSDGFFSSVSIVGGVLFSSAKIFLCRRTDAGTVDIISRLMSRMKRWTASATTSRHAASSPSTRHMTATLMTAMIESALMTVFGLLERLSACLSRMDRTRSNESAIAISSRPSLKSSNALRYSPSLISFLSTSRAMSMVEIKAVGKSNETAPSD